MKFTTTLFRIALICSIANRYTISAILTCPGQCHCSYEAMNVAVDCSGVELTELPEFDDFEVHILDLTNNKFVNVPPELQFFGSLQYLDFSGNQFSRLRIDSFKGLTSLRHLDLSRNNLSSWSAINPRYLFEPTLNLVELNLSGNLFSSFSSNDENLMLISNSIKNYDISNCKIVKIVGEHVLQGMKNLDSITFAGNPIRSVSNLVSQSLLDLNLSGCMLTTLKPTVFEGLSKLKNLDLSKNYRLSLINVESRTLERIDLSYCNMDIISLDGFPSLRTAILKGNMIRSLNKNDFSNNLALENLDISYNVITTIHPNTFATLKNLQNLNLLYNSIGKIERDTFKENKLLFRLNLSKNHIGRFNRIKAESLIYLNMSWCEILEIDADALAGMPNIIELDLTGNLISTLPVLDSKTLQTLDLSINRISQISAVTFSSLTELIKINLSGNRFSIPFSRSYFYNNSILNEIWLGDNPWICNCHDNKFYDFFTYLTEYPSRLNDRSTLKCASPEEIAGKSWESACYKQWNQNSSVSAADRIWTFFLVSIVVFFGCMCILMSIKKAVEGRKRTRREREREQILEEQRDINRQTQMRMQQEAQLNAPDPRESRPPCYEEALRMPKLDRHFVSLNDISTRIKNKIRKKSEVDNVEVEELQMRRAARSEIVLSMRESVSPTDTIPSPVLPPRSHPFEVDHEQGPSRILNLSHSPGRSRARTAQATTSTQPIQNSNFDEIRDFNRSAVTLSSGSPYPNRQLKQTREQTVAGTTQSDEIEVIEDHFGNEEDSNNDSDSDEFITIPTKSETNRLMKKSDEEFEIVVHDPPKHRAST